MRAWLALFVLSLLFRSGQILADGNQADPYDDYYQCDATYGSGACVAYGAKEGAVIYREPNVSSEKLDRVGYGDALLLLKPGEMLRDSEWVPSLLNVAGPKGPNTVTLRTWIRREQLVINTDFRRVTRCWPLEFIIIPGPKDVDENLPEAVFFSPQGIATGWNPRQKIDKGFSDMIMARGEQHTYYSKGIFVVQHDTYVDLGYGAQGAIELEKHVVTSGSLGLGSSIVLRNGSDVKWYSQERLRGCKEIPETDDKSLPTPKKFFH